MNFLTFSWTQVWCVICQIQSSISSSVGSSPFSNR